MIVLTFMSFWLLQTQGPDTVLAAHIRQLAHVVLTISDEKQEEAAEAEAREIFRKQGLPSVAAIGDEAAYQFVVVTCSPGPAEFRKQVLRKAFEGAKTNAIPTDAASYCAARVRQETAKSEAGQQTPADPALARRIEQLFKADQAVRQKGGFDMQKMLEADREDAAELEEIFARHGVPTYRMVGPQAAADFVVMVQHQSADFRRRVLPALKVNVDAGQADPGSYAMVFDRSQTDAGKKQRYGENLLCDTEDSRLHTGPIEDEEHVDERRAALGLMRLKLYAQLVIAMSPNVCAATRVK